MSYSLQAVVITPVSGGGTGTASASQPATAQGIATVNDSTQSSHSQSQYQYISSRDLQGREYSNPLESDTANTAQPPPPPPPTSRLSSNHAMTAKDWASHFWITLVDEEGDVFYANPQTGERKWNLPTGSLVLPRSVEGEWYELWSDEHDLPYYYHTRSSETTWYKPDGFVIPLKAVQRYSAGKRFSLSLDSGSSILIPQAPIEQAISKPLPKTPTPSTIDTSANFSNDIRNHNSSSSPTAVHFDERPPLQYEPIDHNDSSASDNYSQFGQCDPFHSALMLCMSGKKDGNGNGGSALQSPKTKITNSRRSKIATEAMRVSPTSPPAFTSLTGNPQAVVPSWLHNSSFEHVDTSKISASSSSGTVSTPSSTPLNTPKATQDGFPELAMSISVSADTIDGMAKKQPFNGQQLPSLPPTPTSPTRGWSKSSLYANDGSPAAITPAALRKAKPSSPPAKLSKKSSRKQLAEPVELRPPLPEQRKVHGSNNVDATNSNAAAGNKTDSPVMTRSPTAIFAAMFGRNTTSPKVGVKATPIVDLDASTGTSQVQQNSRLDGSIPAQRKFANTAQSTSPSSSGLSAVPSSQSTGAGGNAQGLPQSKSGSISTHSRPPSVLPQELLDEIHRFSFAQYARAHFAAAQRGRNRLFLRKTVPLEESMRWQLGDLEAPILQLNKQLNWDALQCFTHLQRVMGDRPLKDSDIRLSMEDINAPSSWDAAITEEARKLLTFGIGIPELRDEIYVQLICQLNDNPSAISIYRGYQLLQVLLLVFPPSPQLEPTLRQFLQARRGSHPRSRLGIIARYALVKLDDIIHKGPRGAAPTSFEIQAASEGAFQPSVFGETLDRVMTLQKDAYPDVKIPIVLSFLADGVLALGGLKTTGIFRVPADLEKVKELRITIDQGRYSFFGYEDAHIAASLFKLWLRELRDPLIPMDWYHQCMESAVSETRCIEIIQKLPSLNRRIVAFVISFLQIFKQDAVSRVTMVPASSLAMIFTPSFFRGPATSKTFNASPSGTSETITRVFHEARIEQQFVLNLIEHMDVTQLEDEDDWIPTHGRHYSLASSTNSSSSSSDFSSHSPSSLAHSLPHDAASESSSRPSLDSTASTMSVPSRPSFASTKRKQYIARSRTQTAEPASVSSVVIPGAGTSLSKQGMTPSSTYPVRLRSATDSIYLEGHSKQSLSHSHSTGGTKNIVARSAYLELPFIRPVIIVDEAD